jgi:hypothetical protein
LLQRDALTKASYRPVRRLPYDPFFDSGRLAVTLPALLPNPPP